MKFKTPCLLLALSASIAFAMDPVDYDKSVAFAQERGRADIPAEKAVYCLGPEQLDEFYFEGDKEQQRVAKRVRIFDIKDLKTVNSLVTPANLTQNDLYEVSVYRRGDKRPVIRIVGDGYQFQSSQFGLKPGDLIIIQRTGAAK